VAGQQDRNEGPARENDHKPDTEGTKAMMTRHSVADEIYRAAIETAGHLGDPVEPSTALRALAYELELRGLAVAMPTEISERAGIITVEGTDGVRVHSSESAPDSDLGGLLRRHGWHRAHDIAFGADDLHVKTVAG